MTSCATLDNHAMRLGALAKAKERMDLIVKRSDEF